jgi:hypothetical protein
LATIKPAMSIGNQDMISWKSSRDQTAAPTRVGFMSQVSPDGQYVVTMLRGLKKDLAGSYFVVNFKDYRFLQVFHPTRGILAWHSRVSGQTQPLPGADDPGWS